MPTALTLSAEPPPTASIVKRAVSTRPRTSPCPTHSAVGPQGWALAVVRLPSTHPEGADPAGGGRRLHGGGWRIVLRRPTLRSSMATDLCATVLAMPVAGTRRTRHAPTSPA